MLLIRLPEESSIAETRPQHAFVAMLDLAIRVALGIQDSKEMREQAARSILDRKIFLVIPHHGNQYFIRKLEKLAVEVSSNDGRKLGEIHDCFEKVLIFAP